jgi:hypothetical protein
MMKGICFAVTFVIFFNHSHFCTVDRQNGTFCQNLAIFAKIWPLLPKFGRSLQVTTFWLQ